MSRKYFEDECEVCKIHLDELEVVQNLCSVNEATYVIKTCKKCADKLGNFEHDEIIQLVNQQK